MISAAIAEWRTSTWPFATMAISSGALLLAIASGFAIAVQPIWAALPIGLLALGGLLASSAFRFAFVTFGGLIVLQSSSGIDAPKAAYLVGCALAFGMGLIRASQIKSRLAASTIRPFLSLSVAWTFLVAVSFPVAMAHGSAPMAWVRDSIPYLLIAAVPFFAIDFLVDMERRPRSNLPAQLFLLYGSLAAFGFFANWMARRGYAEIFPDRLLFSSFIVSAAFFSCATAKSLSGRARGYLWASLASLVFVLLILTGTRTSFVLLAAPTVILVGQGEGLVRSLPRAFVVTLAAVTVGVVAVVTLPEIIDVEMTQIVDRFSNLGEITGDTAAGQSFRERSVQTTLTVDAFLESPLLGVGPGRVYAWSALVSGDIKSSFVLDSPLSIPAKFGLVGLLVYLFTLGTLFRFQRRLARVGERCRVERDMVRGFLTIAILLSLLGSPVDDKGFGFVIAFLLTIGVYQILRMERELSHNASSRLDPDAVLQSGGLVEG